MDGGIVLADIINTAIMTKEFLASLSDDEILYAYNGIDNLATRELFDVLADQLEPETTAITYNFERNMQAPALSMMRREFRIDHERRLELIALLKPQILALGGMKQNAKRKWEVVDETAPLQRLAIAMWDKPINYNSRVQLKNFLYDDMRIPYYYHYDKGKRILSTRREQLEQIIDAYPRARFFLRALLHIRDIEKKLTILECEFEPNGRLRTSFNIGGTETGRWSSKKNCFWRGTNFQNITHDLREIFVPDPGYTMFYADLKAAESKTVAYLAEDQNYIDAHERGDPHVRTAAMIFGIEETLEAAKEIYYRHFKYRDFSKKAGHATNYYGTPKTIGHQLHILEKIIHRFQALYYGGTLTEDQLVRWEYEDMIALATSVTSDEGETNLYEFEGAFPGIRRWHEDVRKDFQVNGFLVTALGRRRNFWGRLSSDATFREAVAQEPQSTVADILNIGLFHVWRVLDGDELQLLANGHDAMVGQVKQGTEEKYAKLIPEVAEIDVVIKGRIMRLRYEVKFGKNWKECS